MKSRTALNYLQREMLATWLRNNYVPRNLTDAQAVEGAKADSPILLADLNLMHVAYMRKSLSIAKNYARKPKPKLKPEAQPTERPAGYLLDHLRDQLEAQREIVRGLNRAVSQLGERVRKLEAQAFQEAAA